MPFVLQHNGADTWPCLIHTATLGTPGLIEQVRRLLDLVSPLASRWRRRLWLHVERSAGLVDFQSSCVEVAGRVADTTERSHWG
jgi:hypothetical protein